MHDDHQRTTPQQALQAVHCLSKILSWLPNDLIEYCHEGFQNFLCENALSQNLVFRQGSQESNHSGTISMLGFGQNVTEAFFRIVNCILRKFEVRLRTTLRVRVRIASCNDYTRH